MPHRPGPLTSLAIGTAAALWSLWFSTAPVAAAADPPVIAAVRSGDVQVLQALLKSRPDVNTRQGDGATALHWAAHLDDVRSAQLLLKAGARPGLADDTGATPLYLACVNGSRSVRLALPASVTCAAPSVSLKVSQLSIVPKASRPTRAAPATAGSLSSSQRILVAEK